MRNYDKWTREETEKLRIDYPFLNRQVLEEKYKRSIGTIKSKASILGILKDNRWKTEEIERFKLDYPYLDSKALVKKYKRSIENLYVVGRNLGLKRINKETGKNNFAEKNGMWLGDNVGYGGVHRWIRKNKPKPEFCEICEKNKPHDLANISQKYHRDINDFRWLCRRCHMISDNRMNNLKRNEKISLEEKNRRAKEYRAKNRERINLRTKKWNLLHPNHYIENKDHINFMRRRRRKILNGIK